MRLLIAAVLLCTTSPLAAQIVTPDRPVTDPKRRRAQFRWKTLEIRAR